MSEQAEYGTHKSRHQQLEEVLTASAQRTVDEVKEVPGDWGVIILGFEFSKPGDMFYASNGNRDDVIKAMEEFIATHKTDKGRYYPPAPKSHPWKKRTLPGTPGEPRA